MQIEELFDYQTKLMDIFYEQLLEAGHSLARTTPDESDGLDIVSVEFDQLGIGSDYAIANCFFIPAYEDDMTLFDFTVSITITDEIPTKEAKSRMLQAINYVNFMLPIGACVLDSELNVLSYKRNAPISVTIEDDEKLGIMGRELFNGIYSITPFIAPLLALANDDITIEEFGDAVELALKLHREVAKNN